MIQLELSEWKKTQLGNPSVHFNILRQPRSKNPKFEGEKDLEIRPDRAVNVNNHATFFKANET